MGYRPEIDGLRAVAVVPVILFHAGFTEFSGGFIGVDVFFVISGYLITTIILTDIEQRRFSFRRFYERRVRRILPALLFVIIGTFPLGLFWLAPDRLEELAFSSIAAIFSASNFYFWSKAGYFAESSERQPLLHTWSLGVEEQFYIAFPIALLVLSRLKSQWMTIAALVLVAVASLALSEWAWRKTPDANFFLAPTRAWELLAGVLCAFALCNQDIKKSSIGATAGLAMILSSVAIYSPETPFPSYAALLPVVGTTLIIMFADESNIVGRLLSLRPLVGLGLISYSAYLWHQPLFAFARLRLIDHPPTKLMLALSALSIGMAWLTYKYVEQPFRNSRSIVSLTRGSVGIRSILAASVVVVLLSATVIANRGLPDRFDRRIVEGLADSRRIPATLGFCKSDYYATAATFCRHGIRVEPTVRIALIGDSHASQWAEAIGESAVAKGWALDTYAKSACPIAQIDLVSRQLKRTYDECRIWRSNVLAALKREKYDIVIATQSSSSYLRHNGKWSVPYKDWERAINRLAVALDALPGRWLLLTDNPEFRARIPAVCLAQTYLLRFGDPRECDQTRSQSLDERARLIERRATNSSAKGMWVDPSGQLCGPEWCTPHSSGRLFMSDNNHLSAFGARELLPEILEALNRVTPLLSGADLPVRSAAP